MIDKSLYPSLAKKVLDSVNAHKGDAVYIEGGEHQRGFMEEIGIQVIKRGGEPYISGLSDAYRDRHFEESTEEQLRTKPRIHDAIVDAMDVNIRLDPYEDQAVIARHKVKTQARREGLQEIYRKIFSKHGKRWVFMGWATESMSRDYGVPVEEMERLVIGGCDIDYDELNASCACTIEALKGARLVHITDSHGTDLWLNIERRPFIADSGTWSDEREVIGDLGCNLPAGEVFCAPHDTYGAGTLYCPVTEDTLTYKPLSGLMLHVKDGVLLPEKCTADGGQDYLKEVLERFVEMDMKEYGAPNALKVAELGIGLNPAIDRAIGYTLTDEKVIGSVHVAFGDSEGFGGNIRSTMHWDFVTAPEATVEVTYTDGSRRFLMKDGKML